MRIYVNANCVGRCVIIAVVKKALVCAILSALAVGGCAGQSVESTPGFLIKLRGSPHYSLSEAEMGAIKARLTPMLKDPDSANFGPTMAGKQPDGTVLVCGNVNAKNSFGGYIGMKPYYATLKGGSVVNLTLSEEVERLGLPEGLHPCPL